MAENWLTYLLGNPEGVEDAEGDGFLANSRLFRYFADGNTLLSKNQPYPFGQGGIFGPGIYQGSGNTGGTTSPPPPTEPPPGPTPTPRWAFPDYTQDWAFTPPAPFYTAPPPVFNKTKYK